jgi:hypothetical protein
MKPIRILLYILGLTSLGFIACKRETEKPVPNYQNYFPLHPGAWRIYQVDSLGRPTPQNNVDTLRYQIKEVVDSAFTDGSGKQVYKVLRYRRATESDPWSLIEIVAAGISGNEAIAQEGNFRYVKLVFPVENGRIWNANLYNPNDPSGFYHSRYTSVNESYKDSLGNTFDSTAVVELNKEEIAIYTDYNTERYATGVGLIDMQHDSVTTQAESFWIRKRIVSFGR